MVISTSGNSKNILNAIDAAHQRAVHVIALSGNDGGGLRGMLCDNDIEICIPSNSTPRIQEKHIFVLHCMCDIIDHQLFANEEIAS